MPRYDIRTPRLFVEEALSAGQALLLDRGQTNYLVNVLRLKEDGEVLVFNGRDGEWRARLAPASKKTTKLEVTVRTREQTAPGDLHYAFAPLKHARLDYIVQKAVEMGVSHLRPVITRYTQSERLNLARVRANAIEAAEQCGILNIPQVAAPVALDRFVRDWVPERLLVFCDEDAGVKNPVSALSQIVDSAWVGPSPMTLLIGPEGGFAEEERAALLDLANMVRLSLGPRILRADTAAVAALALIQAVLGDWR